MMMTIATVTMMTVLLNSLYLRGARVITITGIQQIVSASHEPAIAAINNFNKLVLKK
jgi:hypothetical protein